ncbi:MAG: LysR family transcriptional regulator [Rhizobiales bacterium]|nr:LysR substrate-binding domain-containing protein [Hyphomicrobiales bacterium]NRB14030.1 LysR family transcriptional regulator [Hyphomicrobiales bacterium]
MTHHSLPPLNSLRAFEATARHGNIANAAKELGVSASAISQQLAKLEAHLATQFFTRKANLISITANGQTYFNYVNEAFGLLHKATENVQKHNAHNVIRITTFASFATHWLLPRLPLFTEIQPDVQFEIITNLNLQDLENENIDIGIRFGLGAYKKYAGKILFGDKVAPVATPEIAAQIHSPQDLKNFTLFKSVGMANHFENTYEHWLKTHGFTQQQINALSFQSFSDGNLNIAAALNGQGIYLGHYAYVKDLVSQRRLVNIFGGWQKTEYNYYLIQSKFSHFKPVVQKFHHWLSKQAASFDK